MANAQAKPPSPYRAVFGTAFLVLFLDQITKLVIRSTLGLNESIPVVQGFLNLVHVRNPGAAFSLLADSPDWFRGPFFIVITLTAIVALLYVSGHLPEEDAPLRFALGGVLGGAIGNLIDRMIYGEVIDFIDVHWGDHHWPAFNVADSTISIAVAFVLLHSFVGRREAPASRASA